MCKNYLKWLLENKRAQKFKYVFYNFLELKKYDVEHLSFDELDAIFYAYYAQINNTGVDYLKFFEMLEKDKGKIEMRAFRQFLKYTSKKIGVSDYNFQEFDWYQKQYDKYLHHSRRYKKGWLKFKSEILDKFEREEFIYIQTKLRILNPHYRDLDFEAIVELYEYIRTLNSQKTYDPQNINSRELPLNVFITKNNEEL